MLHSSFYMVCILVLTQHQIQVTRDFSLQEVTCFIFLTTTSCDVSASSLQVGEALIALHTRLMNACPLFETGSKEKLWKASDA